MAILILCLCSSTINLGTALLSPCTLSVLGVLKIMCVLLACRFCVSQHPEIEAKVVEELHCLELLATPDKPQPRPLQYEDLSKLTYLNLVIKVQKGLHLDSNI